VASLSQGRTAAAQCGLFTHKSVPVIFEPPCINLTRSLLLFRQVQNLLYKLSVLKMHTFYAVYQCFLQGAVYRKLAQFNPLKTKRRLLYLKTNFVPRSKHFSSRL